MPVRLEALESSPGLPNSGLRVLEPRAPENIELGPNVWGAVPACRDVLRLWSLRISSIPTVFLYSGGGIGPPPEKLRASPRPTGGRPPPPPPLRDALSRIRSSSFSCSAAAAWASVSLRANDRDESSYLYSNLVERNRTFDRIVL